MILLLPPLLPSTRNRNILEPTMETFFKARKWLEPLSTANQLEH